MFFKKTMGYIMFRNVWEMFIYGSDRSNYFDQFRLFRQPPGDISRNRIINRASNGASSLQIFSAKAALLQACCTLPATVLSCNFRSGRRFERPIAGFSRRRPLLLLVPSPLPPPLCYNNQPDVRRAKHCLFNRAGAPELAVPCPLSANSPIIGAR